METTDLTDLIPTTTYDTKRALRIIGREDKKLRTKYAGEELERHRLLMKYVILKKLKAEKTRQAERVKELDRRGIDTSIPIERLQRKFKPNRD
jgi:hypothetical protein